MGRLFTFAWVHLHKALAFLVGCVTAALFAWWNAGGPLFQDLLLGVGVMFWIDLALGVYCAVNIRGEKFSSQRWSRCYHKAAAIGGGLIAMWWIDRLMMHGFGQEQALYIAQSGLLLKVLVGEITSVLEHSKTLGLKVPKWVGPKLRDLEEQLLPAVLQDEEKQPALRPPGP